MAFLPLRIDPFYNRIPTLFIDLGGRSKIGSRNLAHSSSASVLLREVGDAERNP
jgi:hypothetical protein